jgi:glycerophosphoryl diester phosphodiesterase
MTLAKSFLQAPYAHRALHDAADGRPENSMAAARAAIARGYGIEIDLQMSKDGVPMVFHDYTLERMTAHTGAVAQCTAKELGGMVLNRGNEGIPTLAEFLNLVDAQVPMLVEIKDQDGALGPNVGALAKAACAVLQEYKGDAALMSFNPHTIAKCANFAPEIPRGLVTGPFLDKDWQLVPKARRTELAEIADYNRVGASFISHNVGFLDMARVAELKDQGAAVFCWTVRSDEMEKIARKVADNITFEGYLA